MGASGSKIEEDKALRLCRERKKYVREALDGRCSLAATHVAYIESLKIAGTALRKFVEPEAPTESSLYTSASATPEPITFTEKTLSHFSLSSPSISRQADPAENLSPSPSPPPSHINFMKFRGTFSKKFEEKPPVSTVGSVTSTERPENPQFESSPIPYETSPWDYFGLSHPIDNHLSSNEERGMRQGSESNDGLSSYKEGGFVHEPEEDDKKEFDFKQEESEETEDEFDDPSTDTLVRSFENVNRVPDHGVTSETDLLNLEKSKSPSLSPLRAPPPVVEFCDDVKISLAKADDAGNKVNPKDFFSSMKEIEHLFVKASDSGREVPRMLEANKFHFRPIFPGQERGSVASMLLKSCFSCGDDPSQVPEEPAQNSVKYLTWHRTTSSRSSSSRNLIGANSRDDVEDATSNLFDSFCMNSGSHASTLDRLYAWERKLYDEVKASEQVRKEYDLKRRLLRQLESKGESSNKIDKTRAVVKDLHSRIGVSVHRIDTISKKIEELRDRELQPQLEELIEGLRRMWEVMLECHDNQLRIVSIIFANRNIKISLQSEARQQIAIHLENELFILSSSFTKWINAQITYVKVLNHWLLKCVSLPQQSSRKRRKPQPPQIQNLGPPPIYITCHVWLEKLNALPTKEVVDSIKGLASEISHLLPRQEKNQGKGNNGELTSNLLRDEAQEDTTTGLDGFQLGFVVFIGKLNSFAECSVKMFSDLETAIHEAKTNYDQF